MNYTKQPEHVKRRIEFLLQEARLKSPRDQIITFVMRVISNHASVNFDGGSSQIKKNNLYVSQKALDNLYASNLFDNWTKSTINEHQIPLKITWNWLLEKANIIESSDIWSHFVKNPMVTILKSEDKDLNKIGARSSNDVERYLNADIKIITLKEKPYEIWKSHLKSK